MRKFVFDIEKMENSPLRQHVKEKEKALCSESKLAAEEGFLPIKKSELHRVAVQLALWDIKSPYAVIKFEGPTYVLNAVDITLQNLTRITTSPKSYFRGVLKKLQKTSQFLRR